MSMLPEWAPVLLQKCLFPTQAQRVQGGESCKTWTLGRLPWSLLLWPSSQPLTLHLRRMFDLASAGPALHPATLQDTGPEPWSRHRAACQGWGSGDLPPFLQAQQGLHLALCTATTLLQRELHKVPSAAKPGTGPQKGPSRVQPRSCNDWKQRTDLHGHPRQESAPQTPGTRPGVPGEWAFPRLPG